MAEIRISPGGRRSFAPPLTAQVTQEQAEAYCELMSLDPTAETIKLLRESSPQNLLMRAGRKNTSLLPWAPPSDPAQERFSRAFGLD